MSNDPEEPNAIGARNYTAPTTAATTIGVPGAAQATAQVNQFTAALTSMSTALQKLSQNAGQIGSSIGGMMGKIGSSAQSVGGMIGNVGSAMFGSANQKGWVQDFMMFPTRYMRSNILDNRQLALSASAAMGPQAFGSMASTQQMMAAMAGNFGNFPGGRGVLGGSPQDLLALMNIGGKVGAGMDWRYYANQAQMGSTNPYGQTNSPRAAGFLRSVYEAQRINPGAPVQELASAIGGYSGNVGAQQQSAFLTGGAFSMIGAGNRQKSISEWAEGIQKWLANLRAGSDRGKAFTYPELMSQNFPGSNIDAWLSANGVTEEMKTYFWSYSLAASQRPGSTADKIFAENAATTQSVAYNRLQASGAQTRTGFQLAGQMAGTYANKEQANQWFSELTGHMLNQILPSAMSSGLLSYMQYLPDTIEEMIMQLSERTNLGTLGAGVVGWGSQFPQFLGSGDVGDVGDYGPLGATSTAGMHPDARKRVDAMMRANPNLRINSGYRDLGTQRRLKRKGVGRVSGKPSDHTRGMAADIGPASQYPWLVKNARKFGLKSGAYAGEPWHVGMGDVGVGQIDNPLDMLSGINAGQDIWEMGLKDTISSLFSGLFSGITTIKPGQTPEEQMGGIAGGISGLMKALMGIFTQGEVNRDRLLYRDVYSTMVEATNRGTPGLPTTAVPGNWWSDIFKGGGWRTPGSGSSGGGGSGGGPQGLTNPGGAGTPAGGQTLDAFFREVLAGGNFPVTSLNLAKLAGIAKTEGNRSGTYNPFNSVNKTTGSTNFNSVGVQNYPDWDSGVRMTTHVLQQANTSGWRNNLMSNGSYSDWWAATNAFYTWGRPAQISQGSAEQMLTHNINAGDVGDLDYAAPMAMSTGRSAPMIFQNTFNVGGGGGGGGSIDTRRLVAMMADQLEQEMRRRMSRTN